MAKFKSPFCLRFFMKREELIAKYIAFFEKHGHKRIKNASLIPENDPTVLFTTAGMHPLVPYLLGEPHPQGKRLVNVQRCIRTGDIDSVGDETHHTFFEMLGNWSLGDYFNEEAIKLTFAFHHKELKIPLSHYAVTVFAGDAHASRDESSVKVWKSLGISEERIAYLGKDDNWWPADAPGLCGPDTEQFYWKGKSHPPKVFDPKDKNWVEIGNDVLMGFFKDTQGNIREAKQKNVDFGGGVERTITILSGLEDNYLTHIWASAREKLEDVTDKEYGQHKKEFRIILDHIRASVFIIADGIIPSNTEHGYVLRRLIRRAIHYGKQLGIQNFVGDIAKEFFEVYKDYNLPIEKIIEELDKEEEKFLKTLEKGEQLFEKLASNKQSISGKDAFLLFQSYGFPLEMTLEKASEKGITVDKEGFHASLQTHQELSRTATAGKFKSGLADHSEATTRLHTACHLMLEALTRVLGKEIEQRGSNITSERLRFDFTFDRKLSEEEVKKVEDLVNTVIKKSIPIDFKEVPLDEARKSGAKGIFESKYGERVKVYKIGDFSNEICSGPHVNNTSEIGSFKIVKQESVGSGTRRIKAIIE